MSKLNRIKSRRERAYARWHSLGKQKAWDWVICWDVAYHNEIKNEADHGLDIKETAIIYGW